MGDYTVVDLATTTREEWLAMRQPYIGGSDAAAVAGLSPWRSPYAVAMQKLGMAPPTEDKEAMVIGRLFEGVIAEYALAELQQLLGRSDLALERPQAMYISTRYPWALANVDGLLVAGDYRVGLEVKTASEYRAAEFEDGKCPQEYVVQCLHYMAVLPELEGFWLAAVVGGNKFRLVWVPRDEQAITDLMAIEEPFYAMLQRKEVPVPGPSDHDKEILQALHPETDGSTLVLADGPEAMKVSDLAAQYHAAALAERDAGQRKKAAQNQLRQLLGGAKAIQVPGWKVQRSVTVVEPYMVQGGIRDTLRIVEVK